MIRDYLPIPLIPAAWMLTFATVVYPGIDTYWIQHMNVFITIFLALFGGISWKYMEGEVLKFWRNIIVLGFLFTAVGTAGFYVSNYAGLMFGMSILYWFLAPAAGFKVTSEIVDEYAKEYSYMAWISLPTTLLFLTGYVLGSSPVMGLAIIAIALVQTSSIVVASKMDKGW